VDRFETRFGVRGAVITGVDILRGFAVGMGMDLIHVPGATGYIDTDFDGKGKAAVRALEDHDLIIVHVEAADEAGHLGDAAEKVKALERIDEAVVGPLLEALRRGGDFRIFVAADHPTPVGSKTHDGTPPPFCYAGAGVASNGGARFTEAEAEKTGLWVDPAHQLMTMFFETR
jgi:2,3-bisphosphoglycerate-independent phosphoglycerate mutase